MTDSLGFYTSGSIKKSLFCSVFLASFLLSTTAFSQLDDSERRFLADRFLGLLGPKLEEIERAKAEKFHEANPFARIVDSEELIFSLTKGSLIFDNPVSIIKDGDNIYMSFTDLVIAMNFPIDIDYNTKTASGWFIRESQNFSLDIEGGEIISDGTQILLGENDYRLDDDFETIFIREDILETAFGFTFDYKVDNLRVDMTSEQRLPVEDELFRKQRNDNNFFLSRKAKLPQIKQEYELYSLPVEDVQIRNRYQKRGGDLSSSEDFDTSYSIRTAGDLAYGGLKTYLSGDDTNKIRDFRFTWSKEKEDGDFGVLGINTIEVGDIIPPSLGLLRGSGQESGVRVGNDSKLNDRANDTVETTRFEGDIQPGWDVELYRDNILLRTVTETINGRYLIEDVPLNFGKNDFRLVFYGPQGQIQEQEESIIRQKNLFTEGEFQYALSLTNQNEITYRNRENLNVPDSGTPNLIGTVGTAINDDFSVSFGGRLFEREREQLGQVSITGTNYNDDYILTGTVAAESNGEYGLSSSLLTSFKDQAINIRGEFNTDAFDAVSDSVDANLVTQLNASIGGNITNSSNYASSASYVEQANGNTRTDFGASLSQKIYRAIAGVGYSYTITDYESLKQDFSSLDFNLRMPYGRNYFRGSVSYDLSPESRINSYLLSVNRSFNDKLNGQLETRHRLTDNFTSVQGRLNYLTDYFTFSPSLEVTSDNDVRAYSTLKFGLGSDPYSNQYKMSSTSLTTAGGVSARVFFDENGNGVWDYFEKPVPNAEIVGVQISQKGITNEQGVAFIPTFSEGRLTDIELDELSLEDPYLVSMNEGNSIRARAGKTTLMDFPLAISGEIDGTISYYNTRGQLTPLRNITVFVVDMDGKITNTGQTAYDGFYVVGDIKPGEYKLILDPIVIEQANMVQIQPKGYDFKPTGTVFFDQNFTTFDKDISRFEMQDLLENPEVDRRLVLELGRYNSKLLLAVKWLKYKNQFGGLFGNLEMYEGLVQNKKNDADYKFPLHIGPVTNVKEANKICDELKLYEVPCQLRSISTDPEAKDRKV